MVTIFFFFLLANKYKRVFKKKLHIIMQCCESFSRKKYFYTLFIHIYTCANMCFSKLINSKTNIQNEFLWLKSQYGVKVFWRFN